MMMKTVFSTAYLPPISYISRLLHSDAIIDGNEHYIKQSYRNRAEILTANGLLSLNIPVRKVNGNHTKTKDIRIVYDEKWQVKHWRAITSAYNNAPYFLYFKDDLQPYYEKRYDFLIDFNHDLLVTVLKLLDIKREIIYSESYIEEDVKIIDFRNHFCPKIKNSSDKKFKNYIQVFSDKFDFIPDLSILDLVFNEGKYSMDYMKQRLL